MALPVRQRLHAGVQLRLSRDGEPIVGALPHTRILTPGGQKDRFCAHFKLDVHVHQLDALELGHQGYSVRTDRWRYTLWLEWDGAVSALPRSSFSAFPLRFHRADFVAFSAFRSLAKLLRPLPFTIFHRLSPRFCCCEQRRMFIIVHAENMDYPPT